MRVDQSGSRQGGSTPARPSLSTGGPEWWCPAGTTTRTPWSSGTGTLTRSLSHNNYKMQMQIPDSFHVIIFLFGKIKQFPSRQFQWIDLPSLSRGRRSHSMTTIEGQLAVAGGLGTNRRGEDEFLDDVEIFDGRQWRRAGRGLDQPRSGANLVKIPVKRFSG